MRPGREALHRLVREADVVVESSRPGVAERLGIGYDQLRAIKPTIIYCALSATARPGPLSGLAGHDLNIAGMSGLLQRSTGETPAMPNMLMGDYAGGMMVVVGILSAIVDRERHGRGAFIDVAMLDALMSWTTVQMTARSRRRSIPRRRPSSRGSAATRATASTGRATASTSRCRCWKRSSGMRSASFRGARPHQSARDRGGPAHGARRARRVVPAISRGDLSHEGSRRLGRGAAAKAIPVCPVLTPDELAHSAQGTGARALPRSPVRASRPARAPDRVSVSHDAVGWQRCLRHPKRAASAGRGRRGLPAERAVVSTFAHFESLLVVEVSGAFGAATLAAKILSDVGCLVARLEFADATVTDDTESDRELLELLSRGKHSVALDGSPAAADALDAMFRHAQILLVDREGLLRLRALLRCDDLPARYPESLVCACTRSGSKVRWRVDRRRGDRPGRCRHHVDHRPPGSGPTRVAGIPLTYAAAMFAVTSCLADLERRKAGATTSPARRFRLRRRDRVPERVDARVLPDRHGAPTASATATACRCHGTRFAAPTAG
jgi:crotonobetainyl-CoA:carnitine CoA-transferase CaiB-like acyl-CoA transferase